MYVINDRASLWKRTHADVIECMKLHSGSENTEEGELASNLLDAMLIMLGCTRQDMSSDLNKAVYSFCFSLSMELYNNEQARQQQHSGVARPKKNLPTKHGNVIPFRVRR